MADILLHHFVKQQFQHLMPWLGDPTGREQQKKELEEFIQTQNAKLSLQSESQDLG